MHLTIIKKLCDERIFIPSIQYVKHHIRKLKLNLNLGL